MTKPLATSELEKLLDTEDARRWEDYALHAAGCVECGETSWENCFEGKMLRDAAMATNAASSTTDTGESNGMR